VITISQRYGQTDRQTDRRTDDFLIAIPGYAYIGNENWPIVNVVKKFRVACFLNHGVYIHTQRYTYRAGNDVPE